MSANAEVEFEDDDATGAAAAAPVSEDDRPDWVKEGTADDEDDIPGENISAAKPMEGQSEWIEPAAGVVFTIEKVQLDTDVPDYNHGGDGVTWKKKRFNVWLKVADGIKYKGDSKPKFKGKLFFHRGDGQFNVAVNREAERAGLFDFSVNAKGDKTDYWQPSGGAFGVYNEFLKALGFSTNPAPRNNKAFRDSLIGRKIVYDITKEPKTSYDAQTNKRSRVVGEFENHLRNGRAAKGVTGGNQPSVPATVAPVDAPDWEQPE